MNENGEDVKKDAASASEQEQEVKSNSGASAEENAAEPDWKELLRLERERSEKAESERDNYKEGLLSRKRQEKAQREEGIAGDDDKIATAVQKALEPVVSALTVNKVDQTLATLVADPSKREYVKSLYQTRIQRTGTSDDAIRLDLETALTLANASKFSKENEELKRMSDNRTYVPPNAGGGAQDKSFAQKSHKWSPEQEASLEMRARANGIADVEKYKALAWQAANDGSAFAVKKKYL